MGRLAVLLLAFAGCGNLVVAFPGDGGPAPHACSASAPCAAPLACSPAGECVECISDAQCGGSTPACDLALGRCVACRGTVGCAGPTVCSPARPVCLTPCQSSTECPGFADGCRANACSTCNDDEDCGAGRLCDRPAGRCVNCLLDEHCSGSTPRCDLTTGLCRACVTNADCAGAVCFQGACRPPR